MVAVAGALTVGVSATTVVVVMALVGMSVVASVSVGAPDDGDGAAAPVGVTGTVGAMASAGVVAVVLVALAVREGTAWYPGRASMLILQRSSMAAYCRPRPPFQSVSLSISDPGPFPCS